MINRMTPECNLCSAIPKEKEKKKKEEGGGRDMFIIIHTLDLLKIQQRFQQLGEFFDVTVHRKLLFLNLIPLLYYPRIVNSNIIFNSTYITTSNYWIKI